MRELWRFPVRESAFWIRSGCGSNAFKLPRLTDGKQPFQGQSVRLFQIYRFDGNKREGFIKIIGKEALVMGIWIPE